MERKTRLVEKKTLDKLKPISFQIITVTPEMGLRWLSNNSHNRPIRQEVVQSLTKKILDGNWKVNPPIEVFDTGQLWNGQHRLSAIVKANIPVKMKVIEYTIIPIKD